MFDHGLDRVASYSSPGTSRRPSQKQPIKLIGCGA